MTVPVAIDSVDAAAPRIVEPTQLHLSLVFQENHVFSSFFRMHGY